MTHNVAGRLRVLLPSGTPQGRQIWRGDCASTFSKLLCGARDCLASAAHGIDHACPLRPVPADPDMGVGAHHWGRKIDKPGYTVQLIPPADVKLSLKLQKGDTPNAEAMREAAQRRSMRFLAVKDEEQQANGIVFRVQDAMMRQCTPCITALRRHLTEYGWAVPKGTMHVPALIGRVEDPNCSLPESAHPMTSNALCPTSYHCDPPAVATGSSGARKLGLEKPDPPEATVTVWAARTHLLKLSAALGLLLVLPGAGDHTRTSAMITTTAEQTLRGWGMSLAWEANVIYGSPLDSAQIQDPVEQSRYMDLLFGDPALGSGLGLNVARYNIGGGDNPDRSRCTRSPPEVQPGAQMEGFLTGPDGGYDWSRDASQRRMLHEAQARGASVFEAFSNSAPWWMTVSGCASGAERSGEDNLQADAVPAFTSYLATVAEHFRRTEGIAFASISPVNEPDGTWWVLGNRQEGSSASLPIQEAVITTLARDVAGTGVMVSGTEANNLDAMTGCLAQMDAASLAALGQVNVHQYGGNDAGALRRRVAALDKPLWASEIGCCFSHDHPEIWGALRMATAIRRALRELGAEVWCFWQPDWGIIDAEGGHPRLLRQFYAIAQYTRFIRPGFTVLSSQGDNTLATLSPDGRRLVLVATNEQDDNATEDIDLTQFHRPGAAVAVYRTTADPSVNLAPEAGRVNDADHFIDDQPGSSVNTYVIEGEPIATERRSRNRSGIVK